jgi:hypothetical protein
MHDFEMGDRPSRGVERGMSGCRARCQGVAIGLGGAIRCRGRMSKVLGPE